MDMLPGMELVRTEYRYSPKGKRWAVYREETWKDKGCSSPGEFTLGSKIGEYATREEARREVYKLNGWKMKGKKV